MFTPLIAWVLFNFEHILFGSVVFLGRSESTNAIQLIFVTLDIILRIMSVLGIIAVIILMGYFFSICTTPIVKRLKEAESPKNVNEVVTVGLRIVLTVFLLVVTGYLFTKILNFVGIIPERWAIYENQQQLIIQNNVNQEGINNEKLKEKIIKAKMNDVESETEGSSLEILSIIAIFGGILAYIFNVVIRRELKDDYEKVEQDGRHFTEAQMLKVGGITAYHRFLLYRDCSMREGVEEKSKYEIIKIINKAIIDTEEGIEIVSKLDGKIEKNGTLICILKNNFAWLYLEKLLFLKKNNLTGEKWEEELNSCKSAWRDVLRYAKYAYDRSDRHKKHQRNWEETYEEVKKESPLPDVGIL